MKTDQKKLESRVMDICQDLFKKGLSPEHAKVKILALMATPAIKPELPDFRWGENPRSIFIDSEECIVGAWKLAAYADGSWDVGLCKSPDVGEQGQSMAFTLAAAKSEAEAWARENIMLVQAALKPLKWQETRSHQSVVCPETSDTYTLMGTDDGWHCAFIPAKRCTRHQLKENAERGVAIAAIEDHRNSKLKENLI